MSVWARDGQAPARAQTHFCRVSGSDAPGSWRAMRTPPSVIVFDVNETLSDMAPMAGRFTDVGAPDLQATGLAALAGQLFSEQDA
jgi:hypothetical protein